METTGADLEQATVVVGRGLSELVLGVVDAGADGERALNHAINNLAGDDGAASALRVEAFASLIGMESSGVLTTTQAKQVLAEMVSSGTDPDDIAASRGFEAMDDGELEALVDQAISDHPEAWDKFCAGEEKVQGVFVGAIMKATRGKADGKAVNQLLRARRG